MASPNGRRALLQLFSYLSKVAPKLGLKELSEKIHQAIPETEKILMTLAEQLFEQGEKAGIEKGEKGLRRTVRRLLELKFGPLDANVSAHLEAASGPALETYAERVLTATRVDEVLGG